MAKQYTIPQHWADDGVKLPTEKCIRKVESIIEHLQNVAGLSPSVNTASIEGGVYLRYPLKSGTYSLIIEVGNDLDVGGLIVDVKQRSILCNFDMGVE